MVYVASKNSQAAIAALRAKRDALLKATDWAIMPDSPLTDEEKATVMAYRTALRDCTKVGPGTLATLPEHDLPGGVAKSVKNTLALFDLP